MVVAYDLVFSRMPKTWHVRKIWLVSTGQGTFEEIFYTKPPHIRQLLQEDITQVHYDWDEEIWLCVLYNLIRALDEIVCVQAEGIAVTDLRFLIEMKGIKELGGKILHIEAADQQANVALELRGHRSETELDSPEVLTLRDAHIYNLKRNREELRQQGEAVLKEWGWA